MKKRVFKILILSLCISTLICILIILTGHFDEIEGKFLATTNSIFAFSIAGLCSSTLYEKEKYKYFSIFGMLTALFGCIWLTLIIWDVLDFCIFFCSNSSNFSWHMLWTLIVLSWSSAHISLVLLVKNQNSIIAWVKSLTVLFSVILDIMILLPTWGIINIFSFYGKLIMILVLLITLGTIVAPISSKVYKSSNGNSKVPPIKAK